MAIQRRIAHAKNAALVGRELEVLVEGTSDEHEYVLMGRHAGQAPDIDGQVYLSGGLASPREMRRVRVTQASDYDLVGELLEESGAASAEPEQRRVSLRVLQTDGRDRQRS
jgi:ribosomal protein S12 methylthiotransferase